MTTLHVRYATKTRIVDELLYADAGFGDRTPDGFTDAALPDDAYAFLCANPTPPGTLRVLKDDSGLEIDATLLPVAVPTAREIAATQIDKVLVDDAVPASVKDALAAMKAAL